MIASTIGQKTVTTAMMAPVLPGKREQLYKFAAALAGERASEYAESQESIVSESWFVQETPMGDFLIVTFQSPDPDAVMAGLAASNTPFDLWFKQQALEISGIDFGKPTGPVPEQIFEYRQR